MYTHGFAKNQAVNAQVPATQALVAVASLKIKLAQALEQCLQIYHLPQKWAGHR